METIIEINETIWFEVSFSLANREKGSVEDIRFAIADTASPSARLFDTDEIDILLSPAQAEQLGAALLEAARVSRATPWADDMRG